MHAGAMSKKVDGDIVMQQLSCVKVNIAAAVSTCPASKGMQCTRKP